MKRRINIFFMLMFPSVIMFAQNGPPACDDFVTIQGKNFMCGGQVFYPVGTAYGFNVVHAGLGYVPTTPYANPYAINPGEYFLSRCVHYGPCPDFDHCGFEENANPVIAQAVFTENINNDLSIIHKMGFNMIRTTGPGVEFDYEPNPDNPGSVYNPELTDMVVPTLVFTNINSSPSWIGVCMTIMKKSPYLNGHLVPFRDRLFEFIRIILQSAHDNSLKVILDVGYDGVTNTPGTPSDHPDHDHFSLYCTYLEQLADYIVSLPIELQHTLMAYCVVEEPTIEGQFGNTKMEICEKTTIMYDILKAHDPNHLITIGGGEPNMVLEWDPGVMKVDFISPHPYPGAERAYETSCDAGVERTKGKLYWLMNNAPMPWIIGELGFSAIEDATPYGGSPGGYYGYPHTDGELEYPTPLGQEHYTQKIFAEEILKIVRDCNGSGYTWWQFQEVFWGDDYHQNGYGLLEHGEAILEYTGDICKPITDVFKNYLDANGQPPDPAPVQQPLSYYDPYNHGVLNPNAINKVYGYVKDSAGNPINDAYVYGMNWIEEYENAQGQMANRYTSPYTYSEQDGYFEIIPYNYMNFSNPNAHPHTLINLYCSAVGARNVFDTGYLDFWMPPPNGHDQMVQNVGDITLYKIKSLYYDATYSNATINYPAVVEKSGKNSLTVNNVTVAGNGSNMGGMADFTAQKKVKITQDFHAQKGAKVHIYLAPAEMDCAYCSVTPLKVLAGPLPINTHEALNRKKEIILNFNYQSLSGFVIYPNPCKSIFIVSFKTKESLTDYTLKVFNPLGECVLIKKVSESNVTVDATLWTKGVYLIQLVSENYNETKILIVQ